MTKQFWIESALNAATRAKAEGFYETAAAMLEIAKQLERSELTDTASKGPIVLKDE